MRVDGVYKAGFASTQQAYEAAVGPVFSSLDRLERILEGKDYLVGDRLTEADIRLFVTIVRASASPYLYLPHLRSFPRSASTPSTSCTSSATSARSATGTPPSTCKPATVIPATVEVEYVYADKLWGRIF